MASRSPRRCGSDCRSVRHGRSRAPLTAPSSSPPRSHTATTRPSQATVSSIVTSSRPTSASSPTASSSSSTLGWRRCGYVGMTWPMTTLHGNLRVRQDRYGIWRRRSPTRSHVRMHASAPTPTRDAMRGPAASFHLLMCCAFGGVVCDTWPRRQPQGGSLLFCDRCLGDGVPPPAV